MSEMLRTIQKAIRLYNKHGPVYLLSKASRKIGIQTGYSTLARKLVIKILPLINRDDPTKNQLDMYNKLYNKNNLNICYNENIKKDYDPSKRNILIAIESPAVVKSQGWLDKSMNFAAEISFENFYGLNNYYCPTKLYVNHDRFVEFPDDETFNKTELISCVLSDKEALPGHRLRHRIRERLKNSSVDFMGSGSKTGWIENKSDSLDHYRYQIVIENCKNSSYISEKFYDCIKRKTIPIYWGGEESVKELGFDTDGILFFETAEELEDILKTISQEDYTERKDAVDKNLQCLRSLRSEKKMEYYLSSVTPEYHPTQASYFNDELSKMNLEID